MSNQVYVNSAQKYYALPGLNNYILNADVPIADGQTLTIPFNTDSLIQGPNLLTHDTAGVFTVISAGMYHIQSELGLDSADHAKSDSFEARIIIRRLYDPMTDINARRLLTRMPNEGVAILSYIFIFSLGFTGYLGVGDVVLTQITNNATANVLTVKVANSDFIVTKVY